MSSIFCLNINIYITVYYTAWEIVPCLSGVHHPFPADEMMHLPTGHDILLYSSVPSNNTALDRVSEPHHDEALRQELHHQITFAETRHDVGDVGGFVGRLFDVVHQARKHDVSRRSGPSVCGTKGLGTPRCCARELQAGVNNLCTSTDESVDVCLQLQSRAPPARDLGYSPMLLSQVFLSCILLEQVFGHGALIDPASRNSFDREDPGFQHGKGSDCNCGDPQSGCDTGSRVGMNGQGESLAPTTIIIIVVVCK